MRYPKRLCYAFCNYNAYRWRRVCKSVKSKRDATLVAVAHEQRNGLSNVAKENYIDLYFYEENHLGLVLVVPYAWQEKGATLELPSLRGKYSKVAGFYQTNHQRKMYFFEQETINAAKLVDIFDDFAKNSTQKTVVALDNVPIHKSKLFQSKIE